jgi:hypothetical protein
MRLLSYELPDLQENIPAHPQQRFLIIKDSAKAPSPGEGEK